MFTQVSLFFGKVFKCHNLGKESIYEKIVKTVDNSDKGFVTPYINTKVLVTTAVARNKYQLTTDRNQS